MGTPIDADTEKIVRRKGAGSPAVNRMGASRKSRSSKVPTDKTANEHALAIGTRNDAATFDGEEGECRRSDGMGAAAVSRKHLLCLTRHACVEAALARTGRTATADDAQKWLIDHGYSSDYLGNAAGSLFTDKDTWEFTGQWFPSQRVSNHGHKNRVWRLK